MSERLIEWVRWFSLSLGVCSFVAVMVIAISGLPHSTSLISMMGTLGVVVWVLIEAERRDKLPDERGGEGHA